MLEDIIKELNKKELLDLLKSYDLYIQEFYEYHDNSQTPVCIAEYYNNDYQEMLEGNFDYEN